MNMAQTPHEVAQRIKASIHECAPDHATQIVTVGDLRSMIAGVAPPRPRGYAQSLVIKWREDWLASSRGHWGDAVSWDTANKVARRIDEKLDGVKPPLCPHGERLMDGCTDCRREHNEATR